ncbi:MAG: hypothetical protein IPL13_15325 [Saprospiraceae bacterium]|nr:hypothetical protein [Candidatus Brachybacter algidus]
MVYYRQYFGALHLVGYQIYFHKYPCAAPLLFFQVQRTTDIYRIHKGCSVVTHRDILNRTCMVLTNDIGMGTAAVLIGVTQYNGAKNK